MSQWLGICKHSAFERIKELYNPQFPIEVRYVCAVWLEECMKTERLVNIHDTSIEQRAKTFLNLLVQQIEQEKPNYSQQRDIMLSLNATVDLYRNQSIDALQVYNKIRDVIQLEQYYLDQYNPNTDESIEINKILGDLQANIQFISEQYERFQEKWKEYTTFQNIEPLNTLQNLENTNSLVNEMAGQAIIEESKQIILSMYQDIEKHAWELNQNIQYVVGEIGKVQKKVIQNHLGAWQLSQQFSGNGSAIFINTLDELQTWMERLATLIWNVRNLISNISTLIANYQLMLPDLFDTVFKDVTMLLHNLIVSSFIVEKQPPQVLKTNTRFITTVRFLLTNIGVQQQNPSVIVSILSENQAQCQQKNPSRPIDESSGEIINNTANMELLFGQLTCNFKNAQLKRIKRPERRNTESVSDEKFALRFKSTFQCGDLQITVWAMSLPVVVIVHGNQEPQSWATVTWDNAFATLGRLPFNVVDNVQWSQLAEMLNNKFNSQTGRRMSNEHLKYLYEKVYRSECQLKNNMTINTNPVTWSQFCKEPLTGRGFTFWDWFFSIMKLTRHQLQPIWTDGHILGFINKKEAEELLLKCTPGTFLLRYSDSELGAIIIAYVCYKNQQPHVIMLSPCAQKELLKRSLSDRIKDLNQCITLYPNIPKDTAFSPYYTRSKERNDGYVTPVFKTTVPGDDSSDSSGSTLSEQSALCELDGMELYNTMG